MKAMRTGLVLLAMLGMAGASGTANARTLDVDIAGSGDHPPATGTELKVAANELPLLSCRGGPGMVVLPAGAFGMLQPQFGVVAVLQFQVAQGAQPGPGQCKSTNGVPIQSNLLGVTAQWQQILQATNPAVSFTAAASGVGAPFMLVTAVTDFKVAAAPPPAPAPKPQLPLLACRGGPGMVVLPPTAFGSAVPQFGVVAVLQFEVAKGPQPAPGQCKSTNGVPIQSNLLGVTAQWQQILQATNPAVSFTAAAAGVGAPFMLVTTVTDFKVAAAPPPAPKPQLPLLACRGGPGMAVLPPVGPGMNLPQFGVVAILQFQVAAPGLQAGPGQCASVNGQPISMNRLGVPAQWQQILQAPNPAVRFTAAVSNVGAPYLLVAAVTDFKILTAPEPPLNPPPKPKPFPLPLPPMGDNGTPPPMGGMGPCGGGDGAMAVVEIADPKLHYLNVRNEPNGKTFLGKLPEGTVVSVMGSCDGKPAAGIVASSKKIGGTPGWCQITQPIDGCVAERFLAFGGDASTGMGMPPPPPPPPAPMMPRFSGDWSAEAEGYTYSMIFQQMGPNVTGTYNGSDGSSGTLKGKISKGELRFSWVQSDGLKGTGKFRLSDDGQSFEGSYSLSQNADQVDGVWTGSRN